jgi:hypothetical protein
VWAQKRHLCCQNHYLCTCVSEEGGDGEGAGSEASSLLSYTPRCEEGGDGEAVCSEAPSLLSYTLRYVSFATGVL